MHKRYPNWPTNVTQNYLKLLEINPQTLLKLTHKPYTKWIKIFKVYPTCPSNWPIKITQISIKLVKNDPQRLFKLTKKRYSKLLYISQNWPTNVTKTDIQTLIEIT